MSYSPIDACVYVILNTFNGHRYIGSAVNWKRRFREHLRKLRANKHSNHHLQHAFNQYGENAFLFSIVETVLDTTCLLEREQYHISTLCPEYNILRVADNSRGFKHAPESIQKISATQKLLDRSHRTYFVSPEHRQQISAALKDRPSGAKSEETKKRISRAKKGKAGRPLSDENKAAMLAGRQRRKTSS